MGKLHHIYQKLVDSQDLIDDPIQRELLDEFQHLSDQLCKRKNLFHKILGYSKPIMGLYLWGGVGIGKTFLMDLFFDNLPIKTKLRLHFHAFMQKIQESLRKRQGQQNPLEEVAKEIAQQTSLLCFDEFFVSDIADAMILERLFSSLFAKGVILVATSNIPPSQLYYKGLHRKRFLPAIELIEKHCKIIDVKSIEDYRYRALKESGVYFCPNNHLAETKMAQLFDIYSHGKWLENHEITIENRPILAKRVAKKVIWFDFNIICHTPRSQVDYLRIAEKYTIVFVSNLPVIKPMDKAAITYLIHLIDVFYDQHIKLVLSAEKEIEQLYTDGDKIFEYQRTMSRLHEMRTEAYIEGAITKHESD